MKDHPATQYKRKYNDIVIKDTTLSTSQPVGIVGRRTGEIFVDDHETDYDFLLKDNLQLRPPTIGKEAEKYLSNSSSSDSESSNDDSSSEAVESNDDDEEESKEIKNINIEEIRKNIMQAEEAIPSLEKEEEIKPDPIKQFTEKKRLERESPKVEDSFKTKEEIDNDRKKRKSKLPFDALSSIKKPNRNDMSIDDNMLLVDEMNKAKKRASIMNTNEKNKGNDTLQLDGDLSFSNKENSPDLSFNELYGLDSKESKVSKTNKMKKTKSKQINNKTIPEEEPEKEQESQEVLMKTISSQQFKSKNKIKKPEEVINEEEEDEKDKIAKKKKEMESIERLKREIDEKKAKEKEEKERKAKQKQDKAKEKEKAEKAKEERKRLKAKEKEREEKQKLKEQIEKENKKKEEQLAKEKEEKKKQKEKEDKKRKQERLDKEKAEKEKEDKKRKLEQSAKDKENERNIQLNKDKDIKLKNNKGNNISVRDINILQNQPQNDVKMKHSNSNDVSDNSENSIDIPSKRISFTKSKIVLDDFPNDNINDYPPINSLKIITDSDLPVEKVNISIRDKDKGKDKIKEEKLSKKQNSLAKETNKIEDKNTLVTSKKILIENDMKTENKKDNKDKIKLKDRDDNEEDDSYRDNKKSKIKKSLIKLIKDDEPKKSKAKRLKEQEEEKEEERRYPPKKIKSKKIVTQTEYEKITYSKLTESVPIELDVVHTEEDKTFGNGRYSLRLRVPRLNKLLGEKITYVHTENGDEIKTIHSSRRAVKDITEQYEISRPKRKKLRKSLKTIREKEYDSDRGGKAKGKGQDNDDADDDSDDELNDSYSEIDEDNNVKLLVIKPLSQKSLSKNYQTALQFKVRESSGRNSIIINDKEYRNLKKNSSVNVPPNCEYQIKNYSKKDFVVAISFLDESDDDDYNQNRQKV